MSGLHQRVLRSALWSTGGAFITRVSSLAVGIVAARLLTPHEFGVFAVALVTFTVMSTIGEMGIASAILRERGKLDESAPTAVTLSWASGISFAVLAWVGAPYIAAGFGTEEATDALRVLGLFMLCTGPAAVPSAQLGREFRQDKRTIIDFIGLVIGSVTLIAFALMGWGALALAWSRVAGQVFVMIALNLAVTKRYMPGFNRKAARRLLGLGLPLAASNLVSVGVTSTDIFVITKQLSPFDVGIYNLALTVSGWPISLLIPVLANVGLPLMSRFLHDPPLLRELFVSATQVVSGLFWPASAMLAGLAPWLVAVLYGDKWAEAAPLLALLAISGAAMLMQMLIAELLVAGGFTSRYLLGQLVYLALLVPAVWFSVDAFGIEGAAVANVIVATLMSILLLLAARPLIGAAPLLALTSCLYPLLSSTAAGFVAYEVARTSSNDWISLILGGLAGLASYVLFTFPWLRRARDTNLLLGRRRHELDDGQDLNYEDSYVTPLTAIDREEVL